MFFNCTKNGHALSCFENFGRINNTHDCKKNCYENNLRIFGLIDFYHFTDQLLEKNLLQSRENDTKSTNVVNICTDIKFNFQSRTWIG